MAEEPGASERVFDLSQAWPGAWFEEVLSQSDELQKVSELIGRNTMGLALVAGARITSLSVDPHFPDLTSLEYSFGGEGEVNHTFVADFRRRIGAMLLRPITPRPLPKQPTTEELQTYIGGRYLLEASLFGVAAVELRVGPTRSEIAIDFSELRHELSLQEFRDVIDDRVRSELGLLDSDDSASIDLAIAEEAEEANARQDWDATIEMLTPWLTPVTMLLRTGEAEGLGPDVLERLSVGLELLGTAYANSGDTDAACEVLRLGVQWEGEGPRARDLYLSLGDACMSGGKHGEAIGVLRRAISLGAAESESLPRLAKCFLERGQYLASIVCVQRALRAGATRTSVQDVELAARARLGGAWTSFEALLGLLA